MSTCGLRACGGGGYEGGRTWLGGARRGANRPDRGEHFGAGLNYRHGHLLVIIRREYHLARKEIGQAMSSNQGLGIWVQGFGLRVQGLGFRGLAFGTGNLRFRVQDWELRVKVVGG